MIRAAGGDGALLAEARAHFVRHRPDVMSALRRAYPDITQPVVDEIADEWITRSLRRYSALLDGRNDGLESLTPSGLLLTIAFEGQRPEGDPVRVLAETHQARIIELLSSNSESTEEATFQVRTIGARLARSTAGWEAELRR
jgi:hypothetical protein